MPMTIYYLDAETFARFEHLLTRLYGHGEILTPDARRDLAHQFGLVRDTIAACRDVIEDSDSPLPSL